MMRTFKIMLVIASLQRVRRFWPKKGGSQLGSHVRALVDFIIALILFIRTEHHTSQNYAAFHYTVRGFSKDGFAYKTIYIFSRRRRDVYLNGGKRWKIGHRRLIFHAECERCFFSPFFQTCERVEEIPMSASGRLMPLAVPYGILCILRPKP